MSPLEQHAIRLFRRYAVEVVERFALCPWAEPARRAGRVTEAVVIGSDGVERALAIISAHAGKPQTEILLLLFPELDLDARQFDRFAALLRDADARRHPLGEIPFAMAAFHPDAAPDLSDPELLIPYFRRTPDPTLQLVRCSVLERVRGARPGGTAFVDPTTLDLEALRRPPPEDLRERIAQTNQQTLERVGLLAIEQTLTDIFRDRDRTYAELGLVRAAIGRAPAAAGGSA